MKETENKCNAKKHLRKTYSRILIFQFCLRYEENRGSTADFFLITVKYAKKKAIGIKHPMPFIMLRLLFFDL